MDVCESVDTQSPRLITGDFNLTPWSPWFDKICQTSQTSDAATGFGVATTWQVFPTLIGGLKIDHTLVSDDIGVVDFRVGPDIGSDHRPTIIKFQIRD